MERRYSHILDLILFNHKKIDQAKQYDVNVLIDQEHEEIEETRRTQKTKNRSSRKRRRMILQNTKDRH